MCALLTTSEERAEKEVLLKTDEVRCEDLAA